LIESARGGVYAGGDEVAILGVEQKDEPQQHREHAVVEMILPARGERLDARGIGHVKAAKQLMQRAQHLRCQRGRDLRLRVAASLQDCRRRRFGASLNNRNDDSSSFSPPSIGRPPTSPSERIGNAIQPLVSPRGA